MATLFELKEEILNRRKVKRKGSRVYNYIERVDHYSNPENLFADDWELEPLPKKKKKVTMYQFIYYINDGKDIFMTSQLYESEPAFRFANSCREILKTIPHELEVEE